nr:hypothetical protein BaRGS_003808 [Batillaria attramentaria]
MSSHYQTFPFQSGTDDVDSDTFCVFEAKTCHRNERWDTHRGKIISNYHHTRKTLVRAFRGTKQQSRKESHAKVKKLILFKEVLAKCPDVSNVKVARTFCAEIDEVGFFCHLMSSDNLQEGTCVVIQDLVEGKHDHFDFPARNEEDEIDINALPNLLELATASFRLSRGRHVISEMKGVKVNGSETLTYIVTSVTVHSVEQEYGETDLGLEGIRLFQNLANIEDVHVPERY